MNFIGIPTVKNKELKYKENNGGEREVRHHRHHREEKGYNGMATSRGCQRREYRN
jgi:hypothetical protein